MVRDIDFKDRSHQRRLNNATDITNDIFQVCSELLAEFWDLRKPLRLLGVALTDIIDDDGEDQLCFFDAEKNDRARMIDKTVDSIRNRFGGDMIVRGVVYKKDIRVGKKNRKKE